MKANVIMKSVMVAMMMMVSANGMAQRDGGMRGGNNGGGREMVQNSRGGFEMRSRGGDDMYNRGGSSIGRSNRNMEMRGGREMGYSGRGMEMRSGRGMEVRHGGPRLDCHGYVPGWEGRVRFYDGRWGYYRDNCWMWYDTYFEPDYYFAHPVTCFHAHSAGAVVAGVVGGAILGGIIGALCH